MASMDCNQLPESSAKFAHLNTILKRPSAFGNETGKLGIGEHW